MDSEGYGGIGGGEGGVYHFGLDDSECGFAGADVEDGGEWFFGGGGSGVGGWVEGGAGGGGGELFVSCHLGGLGGMGLGLEWFGKN